MINVENAIYKRILNKCRLFRGTFTGEVDSSRRGYITQDLIQSCGEMIQLADEKDKIYGDVKVVGAVLAQENLIDTDRLRVTVTLYFHENRLFILVHRNGKEKGFLEVT